MTPYTLQQLARPPYLRHPAWRWQLALHSIVDDAMPEIYNSNDMWLVEACRFYNAVSRGVSDLKLMDRYPELYEAWLLQQQVHPKLGLKWAMDGYLMTGISDDDIAGICKYLLHGKDSIKAYRSVFFDISEYQDYDDLLSNNLLAISLQSTEWTDCDFIYKMFARHNGIDMFRKLLRFKIGGLLDRKIEEYIFQVTKYRREWAMLQTVVDLQREVRRDVQHLAIAFGQKMEIDVSEPASDTGTGSAGMEILHGLNSALKEMQARKHLPVGCRASEPCTPTSKTVDEDFDKQMKPRPVES